MITFVPLSQSQNRLWQLLMILEVSGQITVMQWLYVMSINMLLNFYPYNIQAMAKTQHQALFFDSFPKIETSLYTC